MNVLDTALYSRLQTTSAVTSLLAGTTSIFHLQAPETASFPYIVFNIQGGGDVNDTSIRLKNLVLNIRAYATGSNGAAQAGSIDAQIDTALHLSPLTVSGWTDIWMARETDIELVENQPNGIQVFTSGGLYRCMLSK
jgi:hypothetical protein